MSTLNKWSTQRHTEYKVKRTVWGTRSPTHLQVTRTLSSLRLYRRWGLGFFHSVNRRAEVVAQIGGRVGRAMRLTWISRCKSNSWSLEAPCHPRATLQQDLGYRRSPGKGRTAGYAHSVVRGSAVGVTLGDMKERPTGERYTLARCAILFVVAEMRYIGTLGISTHQTSTTAFKLDAPDRRRT